MGLLETLGILFMATVAVNVLIGIFAIKNAIPEEPAQEFAHENSFSSLRISKI